MKDKDTTAHLIDSEPVLILGCTYTEILTLAGVGALIGFLLCLFIFGMLGFWLLSIPGLAFGAMIGVFSGGKRLGKKKEGKPDGYINKSILIFISNIRVKVFSMMDIKTNSTFIDHVGSWRIHR